MTRLREEFDADRNISPTTFVDFKTGLNRFELICSECGCSLFTDESTARQYVHSIECDADNQFVCDRCNELYEESAYMEH